MNIQANIQAEIPVSDLARALAAENSETQALFFDEFRKGIEAGADGTFKAGMQLSFIAQAMGNKACGFIIAFAGFAQDELDRDDRENEPGLDEPDTLANLGMCQADFR